jgi:predicted N-acyltransferase
METLPTTMIELKANSLEDYLGHLSRNARKDFKHKLRNSASKTHLAVEERQDVGDIIQDIHRLYLNNFSEPDVHFEILTPEFFLNISKNLPGVAKFFITKDGEKIVAFNLCLAKGDLLIDKFIGFDSELSRKYHLYFTTFAYNLEWCIKNGLQYYQPGQSDYYPKVRLGAKLIRLFDYTRAFNPLLHLILKLTAKFIEPKNIDSSLRDVEKIFRRG